MNNNTTLSKIKQYFYISFFVLFFSGLYYISGIYGVLSSILSLSIYSLIFFLIYSIWKSLRKKQKASYGDFLQLFLYKVATALFLIILTIGSFSYYQNEFSPAPMPTYYLSNGEKEIVFQAMSHIGSPLFYKKIQEDIQEKKTQGFVYYFEGVQPGSKENEKKFDDAMGVQFDENLYKNFSKLYGVVHQDNNQFLGLVNDKDFNVDLSIDEIIQFYEEIIEKKAKTEKSSQIRNKSQETIDANAEILKTLASLNDKELSVIRYINKAILNFMIESEGTQNFLMNTFSNQELFSIILDKRNEILSSEILESSHDKIFITYGLLHFKGVLEILKKHDSTWKIHDTKYLYPIQ